MASRALAVLGAAAAIVLVPVAAQATTSQTMHLTGVPIDLGQVGCVPGDLVLTGHAVMHTTVNNAGDSWTTATVTGDATAGGGFTGHGMAWFGVEDNSRSMVNHFTTNVTGTLPDGTTITLHQHGQFTLNANGVPVVNNFVTTCS
jgi:hypothetical protein